MSLTGAYTDYAQVQEYLYAFKARGVNYGIDRMRVLVGALDQPQRQYPVIHLAGTNGKGSVAAMVEAIVRDRGWRTGLYTSPHLVKLGERVQVDRQLLTEPEIVAYVNELGPVAERLGCDHPDLYPSFFEFMTAMAFLQFARRRIDLALIEVGLGGRLDATNVVEPEITVITSIGLDHCEMLGYDLDRIAAEKAGIIKPHRPVVLGRVPAVAEQVIRGIAAERSAPVHSVREQFGEDINRYPETNLEGDYQRWNAATATMAARLLPPRWQLSDEGVARALQRVHWPGRWQRLSVGDRHVILDASHNAEGAEVLDVNLTRLETATGRRPVIITGVLGEYRARPLLEVIARHAREIHLVVPHQMRACSFETLEHCLPAGFGGTVRHVTIDAAFPTSQTCTLGEPDDTVVVTGSIYLIGEVLERIEPARGNGEGHLQDF